MPIEIRELVIRTTVTPGKQQQQQAGLDRKELEKIKQEIIRECVHTVMDKMEEKIER